MKPIAAPASAQPRPVTLSPAKLHALLPLCPDPVRWAEALEPAIHRFGIDTPQRLACFLAQVAHESAHCNHLQENLAYTSVGRLMQAFPSLFPLPELAARYVRNPQALADALYANRLGNGRPHTGDGYRFRGRGLIHIVGRDDYAEVGKALGLDLTSHPDLLCLRAHAAMSAAYFWSARGLNQLADSTHTGDDWQAFDRITRRINGTSVRLGERLAMLDTVRMELG